MNGTEGRLLRATGHVSPAVGVHVAVFLFAATSLVGVWAAPEPASAWMLARTFVWCLALHGAAALLAGSDRAGPAASAGLALTGAALAAYFLTQYRFLAVPDKILALDAIGQMISQPFPRLGTWDPFPNSLGTALDGLACAALGLAFSRRARWLRMTAAVAAALIVAALAISASRGSWMAVLLAMAAAGVAGARLPRPPAVALGGVAVALVSGVVYAAVAPGRPWWLRLAELAGRPDRIDVYDHALTLVRDAMFTGIGGGDQFAAALSRYALLIQVPFLTYSHNLPIDLWLEQGLGGLATWWLVAGALAVAALAGERAGLGWRFRGLWAGILAVHLHGLVDARQSIDAWTWAPFFALTGALAGAVTRHRVRIAWTWTVSPVAAAMAIAAAAVLGRGAPAAAWLANRGAVAQAHADVGVADDAARNDWTVRARADYDAALRSSPDDISSLRRLGLLDLQAERSDDALAHLKRAWMLDPANRASTKAYGLAAMWTGDLDTAARLLAASPNIVAELNAWTYWRTTRHEPALALAAARTSLALDPGQTALRAQVPALERAAGEASAPRR